MTGVWVGFDEKKSLGRLETGGRAAAPIWVDFMEKALEGEPVRDFHVPEGIVFHRVDAATGLLACPDTVKPVFVAYKKGTEPKEYVCREGMGYNLEGGLSPTSVPQGLPPAGLPMGLPPE